MKRWPCIVAGVGLAAACVKVPEFKGGDGGTNDTATTSDAPACAPDYSVNNTNDIEFVSDNGGGTVTAPGYAIHFASGGVFHFPDDVQLGALDIMQTVATSCASEDLAGMALFPAAAIRPNGSAQVGANELISPPGWAGPAIVRLTTHWTTSYPCGATPGGDSMFTLFPDGRVMRHDFMYNNAQQDWNMCSCAGTSFYPTSYWTFARDMFSEYRLGANGVLNDLSTFSGTASNPQVACLQASAGVSIAMGWRPQTASNAHRMIEVGTAGIALVHDFYTMHSVATVGAFQYTTSSVLILGGGGCTVTSSRANEFVTNTGSLYINNMLRSPAAADGIYGGAEDRNGNGGFDLTTMTAELRGSTSAGFTVWLRFPQPTCDISVAKNPDPGTPFFIKQQIDDDEWVIWFRDSLTGSATITINAQ